MATVTKYTHSLATDFGGSFNTTNWIAEIHASGSGITIQVDHVDTAGDVVDTYMKDVLPGGKADLDALVGSHDPVPPNTDPLLRADGAMYSVPKPSSYGLEMCDRDFRINTSIYNEADSFEDMKVNPATNKESPWGELSLVGVYKDSAGDMVACTDQTDADSNCILTIFQYTAKVSGTPIKYELRDGLLYVDPGLAVDWNAMTEEEKFGYRAYALVAPDVPAGSGGSIAIFDSYMGVAPNRTVAALSPQATVLDPAGAAGAYGSIVRLWLFHPAGSKLSHVLRLVTYRAPGTF